METNQNNICQTEIKKVKKLIMPQGWACSDRTCKHNKTVTGNEISNSKQVFGIK